MYLKNIVLFWVIRHLEGVRQIAASLIDVYIRSEQFDLDREFLTSLQLVRVTTKFSDAASKKLLTVVLPLDVSKAFDRVQQGLL